MLCPLGFQKCWDICNLWKNTITENNNFSLFNNIYEISYFLLKCWSIKLQKHNIFVVIYFLYERCMGIDTTSYAFWNNYVRWDHTFKSLIKRHILTLWLTKHWILKEKHESGKYLLFSSLFQNLKIVICWQNICVKIWNQHIRIHLKSYFCFMFHTPFE